ncbi:MAG: dihydrofolate reductase family protein [Flavisolibacter sp.]
MRKIIAGFATSLDGFIEGPNGEYDWIIFDKEEQKEVAESWKKADAVFIGRKTYEVTKAMQSKSKKESGPFGQMKLYVFSKTLNSIDEGYTLVNGDTMKEIEKIKAEKGKDILVFGGAELVSSLLNMGLIDELVLAVMPILIGTGKLLFQKIDQRIHFKLKECKTLSSGVVRMTYERNNEV